MIDEKINDALIEVICRELDRENTDVRFVRRIGSLVQPGSIPAMAMGRLVDLIERDKSKSKDDEREYLEKKLSSIVEEISQITAHLSLFPAKIAEAMGCFKDLLVLPESANKVAASQEKGRSDFRKESGSPLKLSQDEQRVFEQSLEAMVILANGAHMATVAGALEMVKRNYRTEMGQFYNVDFSL